MTATALAALLIAAGALYTWNIGYVGFSPYYAAAARSMAEDPRALAFGALDPGSFITLDKLSGFLLPQALSIAAFGVHPWALAAPQVIEGLVTVVAGYVIGLRWRGRGYGLAIAALLVATPMLAAMSGRPTEDALAAMCQVLAFAALQRSIQTDRSRWLILSGLWVAIGFQAKMMESWLFLPTLVVAFLLGSRSTLRTRLLRVAGACAICVLASLAWMTAIQIVPAAARPFIDGTTNNNVFSMVFGYNGFDRLVHGLVPGAVPQLIGSGAPGHPLVNATRTGPAGFSVVKLLMPQFTTQIGWLFPCALTGIGFSVTGMIQRLRTRTHPLPGRNPATATSRADEATEVGLAVWLASTAAVLSAAFVPHATYFAPIALPVAAFAVHGAARAVTAYRSNRRWGILPALVGAQTGWAAWILALVPNQLRPMLVAVLVTGSISVAALVLAKLRRNTRMRTLGLGLGLVAALIGPVTWSLFTIGSGGGGSASDAFAGPPIGADGSVPLVVTGRRTGLIVIHRPFSVPAGRSLHSADATLLRYVAARNRPGAIPFASDSQPVVLSVILGSAARPLPMGGYSSRAPQPTIAALEDLVSTGRLRFVLLQQQAAPTNSVLAHQRSWIRQRCVVVLSGPFRDRSPQHQDLFDCSPSTPHAQVHR